VAHCGSLDLHSSS